MEELFPGLASAPNLHPWFVHFPIALWWASLVFWTIGLVTSKELAFEAGRWTLWLGIAFGIVSRC